MKQTNVGGSATIKMLLLYKIILVCIGLNIVKATQINEDDFPELKYLDRSVDPCDNFYKYTCGNFKKVHELPENKQVWNHFEILQEEIFETAKDILQSPRKSDDPIALQKSKMAYQSCLDTNYLDSLQLPELDVIKKAGGWPLISTTNNEEIDFTLYDVGDFVAEYGIPMLFSITVIPSLFEKDKNVIYFKIDDVSRPSMINPKFDELYDDYLEPTRLGRNDIKNQSFVKFIKTLAKRLTVLLGSFRSEEAIAKDVDEVVEFMTLIKEGGLQVNDTSQLPSANITVGILQKWTDGYFEEGQGRLDWIKYLNRVFKYSGVKITNDTRVMSAKSHYLLYGILDLVRKTEPRVLKNFALVRLLTYTAPDSDYKMRKAFETFYKEQNYTLFPRKEYCLRKILDYPGNIGLSYAITYEYQRYHYNINKLNLTKQLVDELRESFNEIIEDADWMDEQSKAAALKKAEHLLVFYGFPELAGKTKELDKFYRNIRICAWDHFGNSQRLRAFQQALHFSLLGEPRSRTSWTMSPLETNAYYNRQLNRILLPISILNPVFFNGKMSILDYSRLGTIVGHEITHGFDNSSKQSNELGMNGNLWTQETLKAFNESAECFINQYNNYHVEEINKNVDGSTTFNENLADNGGLREAYRAFKKTKDFEVISEFTRDQLFFIGYGTMWCMTETEQYLKTLQNSTYSPARFRVIGPVSNMVEFAEAFNCPLGSNMNPKDKCIIW